MSSLVFELDAQPRQGRGKAETRRLRRSGRLPAVLYGGGKGPEPLTLDHDRVRDQLSNEAFYSHVLTIRIGDREEKAVLRDVQRHPYKMALVHLDLMRVSETETLRMNVPLHFLGESEAPGVKQGGVMSHLMVDLPVSCLAKDLPEYIEVDVSSMEVGDTVHLSEIKVPEGVEIVVTHHGDDEEYDPPVVTVYHARIEEEPEAAEEGEAEAAEAGEAETPDEGAEEQGEASGDEDADGRA